MKYIYLYTTPTYATKNWYKIGESIKEPSKRIQQQDNASNPEPLIMVHFWKVADKINDKKIHSKLSELGFFRLRSAREWFELSEHPKADIEDILKSFNVFVEIAKPSEDINICNYNELWWFKNTPPPLC
jgi:hypothetical protein